MNSLGITVFFIVLITASFTSLTVAGPQQAMAKSSTSVMKSLIANTTKIGVLSIPIMCNSLDDIMGAVSGVLRNATASGGNETNSTQGIMGALSGMLGNPTASGGNETNSTQGIMGALSGMLGNPTASGGNETNSMQGMMAAGMQNMSQSNMQHLNNLVFCSPATEKTIRSMMK